MNLLEQIDDIIHHELMNNFSFIYIESSPRFLHGDARRNAFDMISFHVKDILNFQCPGTHITFMDKYY